LGGSADEVGTEGGRSQEHPCSSERATTGQLVRNHAA
jgi:hypothetical protein